ncbi:hypothetical protein FEE96_16390 [Parasedimentitalea maritima]|uniref:Peptidase M12A domain-containing protein n=1 Tax=Parasedimentitalea maritima TaxID=2578117 RepID=A0ABY2USA2_9RHOB|nr:hypothetical protein [Zongyanglinia marina]TLP60434.1 hypothetical protein FEE96_16390 [Zongyanglinia marina]
MKAISSRRTFLCGCLSAGGLVIGTPSPAKAEFEEEGFICGALPIADDDIELANDLPDEFEVQPGEASEFKTTPFGVASAKKRWRRKDGLTPNTGLITLGVFFYNGSDSRKSDLKQKAEGWLDERLSKKIAFRFDVDEKDAHIRVNFSSKHGNNSAIGRDALHSSFDGKPTMNIQNMRSVAHEFGHALCLRHEHRHEEKPFTFNEEAVIKELAGPPNNWTESTTRRNILSPLANAKCIGDPAFNEDSVMIYRIPARWTNEGESFSPNRKISDRDRNCMYSLYKA